MESNAYCGSTCFDSECGVSAIFKEKVHLIE